MLKKSLRKEESKQCSGFVNFKLIPILKEKHYYTKDIPLDGDAPKQYIKAYFYYKNCPKKRESKKWHGFFAKYGGKSYPNESVTEYMINKIGEYLGLNMNRTRLVFANGQIRFLSQDFRKKQDRLIHGIEIIAEYLEDDNQTFVKEINRDRRERREWFTFELVETAIKHVCQENDKDILYSLIRLLTFDAIVGNNDRHFYNWGVIGNMVNVYEQKPVFSPIYDSARALYWNKTDKAVCVLLEKYKKGDIAPIEAYINNRSKPRISFEQNTKANHFELISFLYHYNHRYKAIILELISEEKEKSVLQRLKKEMFPFFIRERAKLIEIILTKRFQKLREII